MVLAFTNTFEIYLSPYTIGRRQAGRGSVMLWSMFCWETLGPAIHVDVTLTCITYLSIGADHVKSFHGVEEIGIFCVLTLFTNQ